MLISFTTDMLTGHGWRDLFPDRPGIARVWNKAEFGVNRRGDGILHVAGKSEAGEATTRYIWQCFEGNKQTDQCEIALLCACSTGQEEAVRVLLMHGADASPHPLIENFHWNSWPPRLPYWRSEKSRTGAGYQRRGYSPCHDQERQLHYFPWRHQARPSASTEQGLSPFRIALMWLNSCSRVPGVH